MDRQMDEPMNQGTSPKQATIFPTFQANAMTLLPDKNKMSTDCRTPKAEGVSLCPRREKGQGYHMHLSRLCLPLPAAQIQINAIKLL